MLRLTPAQFWVTRVKDFFLMLDEAQAQRRAEFQQRAELIRLQTCTLINIQLKKEDQLKPAELWHFDWDHTNYTNSYELHELTDQQIIEHNTRLAAMLD